MPFQPSFPVLVSPHPRLHCLGPCVVPHPRPTVPLLKTLPTHLFPHDPEGHLSRERGGGTRLAAMHYNENAARAQATRKDGTKRFSVHYPKYKRGGHVVKKILANATYEYAAELMTEVISQCRKAPNERAANDAAPELPRFLCANFDKPNKDAAIVEQVSRFICDGN